MTELEFRNLVVGTIRSARTAEALWAKLAPYFEPQETPEPVDMQPLKDRIALLEEVADEARYVHQQWMAGALTRRDGMMQLDESLRAAGF